jgi:hypothetical protein
MNSGAQVAEYDARQGFVVMFNDFLARSHVWDLVVELCFEISVRCPTCKVPLKFYVEPMLAMLP